MGDRNPQTSVSAPRRGLAGLARRLMQARLSLAWENAWPALWPAVGIAGTFAALALLDVFAWLTGWLHVLVLAAVAGVFGYALYYGVRRCVWPSRTDALRRIETASGMEHRPLEALQDRLPDGVDDPLTRALWEAHQRQMAERIRAMRVGAPGGARLRAPVRRRGAGADGEARNLAEAPGLHPAAADLPAPDRGGSGTRGRLCGRGRGPGAGPPNPRDRGA